MGGRAALEGRVPIALNLEESRQCSIATRKQVNEHFSPNYGNFGIYGNHGNFLALDLLPCRETQKNTDQLTPIDRSADVCNAVSHSSGRIPAVFHCNPQPGR